MNNDKKIQSSAKSKSFIKRCLALLTCVGMLGSFMMPYQGVLPVVAENGRHIGDEEITENNDGSGLRVQNFVTPLVYATTESTKIVNGVFLNEPETNDEIGYLFGDRIKTISIKQKGAAEGEYTSEFQLDAGAAGSINIDMLLEYAFTQTELENSGLLSGNPYIQYQIPLTAKDENGNVVQNIKLNKSFYGTDMKVTDKTQEHLSYSGTSLAGYYSISQDGLITIRFTDDYISYLGTRTNGFKGAIEFDGTISRGEDADGDRKFEISAGEGSVSVDIDFKDDELSIDKYGTVRMDGTNRYIDWVITIKNPSGHITLDDYHIVDTMTGTGADWTNVDNLTFSPSDSVTKTADGNFALTGTAETVTISYKQNNVGYGEYKNKASLRDKNNTEVDMAEPSYTVNNTLFATKSGKPDYQLANGTVNDKIEWTVKIENMAGDSVKGAVVADAKIPATGVKVYVDEAHTQEVSTSSYTVTAGKVEISNTATDVPSVVYVVYQSSVEADVNTNKTLGSTDGDSVINSVINRNSATITSTNPSEPTVPQNPVTGEVTYKHEIGLDKHSSGFNSDTNEVQWKVTLQSTSDGTDQNKETLEGYKIKDSAFQYFTQDDLTNFTNGFNGFNAYCVRNSGWTQSQGNQKDDAPKVYFEKDSSDSTGSTIIVHLQNQDASYPINKLELYYNVSLNNSDFVDDNGDTVVKATALAQYNQGQEVTTKNTAEATNSTGTISGVGSGTQKAQVRIEAYKTYKSEPSETVVGQTDQPTGENAVPNNRTLEWELKLVKDNGFGGGEVSVTDVLESNNSTPHYMTSAQISNIKVYGLTTNTAFTDSNLITNTDEKTYYSITAENGTTIADKATNFKITFGNDIADFNYRYVYVVYETTAETSRIQNGSNDKFSNKYTFGGTTKETPGLEFERLDPSDVLKIKLNLTKNWDDGKNILGSRPEKITVQVYQALAEDAEGNLSANPTWTEYGSPIELTAGTSTETDTFLLGEDFPQWDETTGFRYWYKIEEAQTSTSYSIDDTNTQQKNVFQFLADSSEKGFAITNKSSGSYGKRAVDKNGNIIKEIHTNDIPIEKVTVDGTLKDCYMLRWDVIVGLVGNPNTTTFTDTLPTEDSVFITGNENGLSSYALEAHYNFTGGKHGLEALTATVNNNGTVTFSSIWSDIKFIRYYTAVPVDSVTDGQIFTNKFSKQGEPTEYEATQKIIVDAPPVEQTSYIKKKPLTDAGSGFLKYGIEFNQNGDKLSNESKVTLTDILTLGANSTKTMGDLSLKLYTFKVYPYGENGKPDRSNQLLASSDANGYGYLDSYNIPERKEITYSSGTSGNSLVIEGLQAGETATITLFGEPNYTIGKTHLYWNDWNGYNNGSGAGVINFVNDGTGTTATFDANGEYTFTYTVPDAVNGSLPTTLLIDRFDGTEKDKVTRATATVVRTQATPAKLEISVPDQKHLYIEYIYMVDGYEKGDEITFDNTVSFSADNASGSDTVNNYQLDVDETHANAEANTYLKIYKTDVGNTGINTLSAQFKVAKYDGENWVYLKSVVTETNDDGVSFRRFVFLDSDDGNRQPNQRNSS